MKKPKAKTRPKSPAPKPVAKPPAKIGRPSSYTQAVADRICEELALGNSLRAICEAPDMPHRQTVFRWLDQQPEFRDRYVRARELQADTFADEMVDLADNAEDANLARLQIDARKWAASKQRPSKYSERVVSELTGKDGAAIETKGLQEFVITDEMAARLKALVE